MSLRSRKKINAWVYLTFPTSDVNGSNAVLRVQDRDSGYILAEIEMDAEQFLTFSRSAVTDAIALVPGDFSRIGKTLVAQVIPLGYGKTDEELKAARDEALREGWEEVLVDGEVLRCHKWVASGRTKEDARA